MSALQDLAANTTYATQHNPNCPSPYLVRIPRGVLDYKSYGETRDAIGFGKTFEEAFAAAVIDRADPLPSSHQGNSKMSDPTPPTIDQSVIGRVTQADREAAAELVIADGSQYHRAKCIRAGSHDEAPTVQAFARHRLASPPAECVATPGDVGKLCEELGRCAGESTAKAIGHEEIARGTLDISLASSHDVHAHRMRERAESLTQAADLLTQMEARVEEAEDAARILQNSLATAQRIIAKREASEMAQAARMAALEKALEPMVRCCQDIEQGYTFDLPDHQTQFPQITMGELRTARALLNPTPTEER